MSLEEWVIALLEDIQTASEKGENFDMHLEPATVNEVAEAYKCFTATQCFT